MTTTSPSVRVHVLLENPELCQYLLSLQLSIMLIPLPVDSLVATLLATIRPPIGAMINNTNTGKPETQTPTATEEQKKPK